MPTIIDSLLYEIGLDNSAFKKGASEISSLEKKAAEDAKKTAQEFEKHGKTAGGFFKNLSEEAGGFLTMMASAYGTAKVAGMTKDVILNAESVGYLAQNLGMSTERLQAWGMAAEKNGSTAAGMTAQLEAASFAVAEAGRGRVFPGMEAFFSLGGTTEELKTVEGYLTSISRILAKESDPVKRTNLANWMNVNPGAFNFLKQGETTIIALVKEQEKFASVSANQAAAFQQTANEFRDIYSSLKAIGVLMVEDWNPAIKDMAGHLKAFAQYAVEKKKEAKKNPLFINYLRQKISGDMSPEDVAREKLRSEASGSKGVAPTQDQKDRLWAIEEINGLPPGSLDAIWAQESSRGKGKMLSEKGAMGHFQFMPKTWEAYGKGGDPYNFEDSSAAAGRFLKDLMAQHKGDFNAALRWYNAGGNYNGLAAHKYASEVQTKMQQGNLSTTTSEINVNGNIIIQSQTDNPERLAGDFIEKVQSYQSISSQAETGTH